MPKKPSPDVWSDYTTWLRENAPPAFANLAPPATAADLAAVEHVIGGPLPRAARRILLRNNGQREPAGTPVLPGLHVLSCKRISAAWQLWARTRKDQAKFMAAHDAACSSMDPGVRAAYTVAGWIPLFQDRDRADYFGIDLEPTSQGKKGQVINFGRDENEHFVAAPDIEDFIAFWLAEARAGRCRVLVRDEEPDDFAHRKGNSVDILRQPAQSRAKKLRAKAPPPKAKTAPPLQKPSGAVKLATLIADPDRDLGPRHRPLDELDKAIRARLKADKRPRSNEAIFWIEGLHLDGRGGSVYVRGDDAPAYVKAQKRLGPVPGADFAVGKGPTEVCKALLLANRKRPQGPRSIGFRYQRGTDGKWSGGYAVETQDQYRAFCKSCPPVEAALFDRLKKLVDSDVEYATIKFGLSVDDGGPTLLIRRTSADGVTFHALSDDLLEGWNALIAHLQSQGISRLLNAYVELKKLTPKAPLKERVILLYCR